MASTKQDNRHDGVTAVGGKNLSQTAGLNTDSTVADTTLDAAAIGPNRPTPTRGPGQPFDIILS